MPAKSGKQLRFMEAIAHGMKSNKGVGPSEEVAEEIVRKTPDKKKKMFMKKKEDSSKKSKMFMKK